MDKETSSRVSSIAAAILNMTPAPSEPGEAGADNLVAVEDYNTLLDRAQTLAGSALSQDQTPGQTPLTWQERLHIEHAELGGRISKLTIFLTRNPVQVSPTQRALLDVQLLTMNIYRRILLMRLNDLEGKS